MASKYFLSALVILSCISGSWQRCFSYHCPHHSPLSGCVQGTWQCQADEFCEMTTHLNHGNSPWVHMDCRPASEVPDCWGTQARNDPHCDPNKHDRICHWCCIDEQCMKDLTQGIFPTPTAATTTTTAAPATTTTTTATTTTTGAAMTSGTTMTTTAPMTTESTTPAKPCEDLYLGDCSVDYGGRCSEPLIAQLCARSCKLC